MHYRRSTRGIHPHGRKIKRVPQGVNDVDRNGTKLVPGQEGLDDMGVIDKFEGSGPQDGAFGGR
jgi:hypothetical protein